MDRPPSILAFAGSLRADSYNKRLVRIAAGAAEAAGAQVTMMDLEDHPLPVFDQDLEDRDGLPASAIELKELLKAHDGLLIAAPEYNSSITAALKNAIDWASRPREGEKPLACFAGKAAAIMSASPGALGGLRGLVHVRAILSSIKVLVIPEQLAVARAHDAFDDQGRLKDQAQQSGIESLARKLTDLLKRLQ